MESARGECGEKISLSEVVSSPFLAAPFSFMSDSKHRIFLAPIDKCSELFGVKNVQREQLNATQEKRHFVLLSFLFFCTFYDK